MGKGASEIKSPSSFDRAKLRFKALPYRFCALSPASLCHAHYINRTIIHIINGVSEGFGVNFRRLTLLFSLLGESESKSGCFFFPWRPKLTENKSTNQRSPVNIWRNLPTTAPPMRVRNFPLLPFSLPDQAERP